MHHSRLTALLVPLARVLVNPGRLLRRVLMLLPRLPVDTKVALDLYDRPHYAYAVSAAAEQARALSLEAVSVIELGVGTGHGLLALERIAEEVSRATGVEIRVFGFDAGSGLRPPADHRDLPYLYQSGYYAMDEPALRSRMSRAELLIGDVRDTVPEFLAGAVPPVGFIAFDLDYYSSTVDAFPLVSGAAACLPRVVCYFDDIGNPKALQTRFSGEEIAIDEFNASHETRKIGRIRGLEESRAIPAAWNRQMYVCHHFDHPLYDRPVVEEAAGYVTALSADGRR